VGFKFSLKKTKTSEAAPTPKSTAAGVHTVKLAEAKDDWSEKTHTSWSEHSGFIEISKVAKIAPPPRLDPRTVPRPASAPGGLSPRMKNVLVVLVLLSGGAAGLYANGAFEPRRQPASVEAAGASELAPAAAQPTTNPPPQAQVPTTQPASEQPASEPETQPAVTQPASAPSAQ
jgi:hypothetical protein